MNESVQQETLVHFSLFREKCEDPFFSNSNDMWIFLAQMNRTRYVRNIEFKTFYDDFTAFKQNLNTGISVHGLE